MPPPITGEASGHPDIRATHRKTLELTRDDGITARATCVVGVGARLDEEPLARLQGRVALTLSVGEHSETVRGRLNPAFRPGDPLVVRRAPAVTRDALIVDADRAAADLPRPFVALLADAGARITLTVELVADATGPGVLVVRLDDLSDAHARAAIHAAHDAGDTVLPAPGLALADAVRAVGGLAPDAEVTEDVPADALPGRLEKAAKAGATRGAIVLDPGTPREEWLGWRAGEKPRIPGARGRRAAFAAEGAAGAGGAAGGAGGAAAPGAAAPNADALARARELAAAGGSTRDVAQVLRDAGVPRRRAYELALGLTADTSSVSRPEPRTSR